MTQLTDYERLALNKLGESIHNGKWSNDGLVQLIILLGEYLNLQTIPNYCKDHNITYSGAKKFRKVTEIFKTKYIIDNE